MADEGGGGGWGWDWVTETTNKVLGVYKEDLAEFTKTITEDTKEAIEKAPPPSHVLSVITGEIFSVENLPAGENFESNCDTYLRAPQDGKEFSEWEEKHWHPSIAEKTSVDVLASNVIVKDMYDALVPAQVSGDLFWKRYFYQTHKAKAQWAKREEMIEERIKKVAQEDEELSWGDEEEEEEKGEETNKEDEQRKEEAREEEEEDWGNWE